MDKFCLELDACFLHTPFHRLLVSDFSGLATLKKLSTKLAKVHSYLYFTSKLTEFVTNGQNE